MNIAGRIAKNVRRARADAGFSQEEVCIRASLHRTEIGLLERGEHLPRIDTAVKLAGAVGVPVAHLSAGIEWIPGDVRAGRFVARQLLRELDSAATAARTHVEGVTDGRGGT